MCYIVNSLRIGINDIFYQLLSFFLFFINFDSLMIILLVFVSTRGNEMLDGFLTIVVVVVLVIVAIVSEQIPFTILACFMVRSFTFEIFPPAILRRREYSIAHRICQCRT